MDIKDIYKELDDMMLYSDKYVRGGISLYNMGVKETDYPLV